MPGNLFKPTTEWTINFLNNSLHSGNLITHSTSSHWIPELPQSFRVQITAIYILQIKVHYVFRLLMPCLNLCDCCIYLYWQCKSQVPTVIKENQTKPNQNHPPVTGNECFPVPYRGLCDEHWPASSTPGRPPLDSNLFEASLLLTTRK